MSRTITVNYARLTATPSTSFDPATGNGAISATYVVGSRVTTPVQNPDGTTSQENHDTDLPQLTFVGSVSIPLGPSDTAGVKFNAMVGQILANEGLSLADGDAFLTS